MRVTGFSVEDAGGRVSCRHVGNGAPERDRALPNGLATDTATADTRDLAAEPDGDAGG